MIETDLDALLEVQFAVKIIDMVELDGGFVFATDDQERLAAQGIGGDVTRHGGNGMGYAGDQLMASSTASRSKRIGPALGRVATLGVIDEDAPHRL